MFSATLRRTLNKVYARTASMFRSCKMRARNPHTLSRLYVASCRAVALARHRTRTRLNSAHSAAQAAQCAIDMSRVPPWWRACKMRARMRGARPSCKMRARMRAGDSSCKLHAGMRLAWGCPGARQRRTAPHDDPLSPIYISYLTTLLPPPSHNTTQQVTTSHPAAPCTTTTRRAPETQLPSAS